MDFLDVHNKLLNSEEFIQWRKENPKHILVNFFCRAEDTDISNWTAGYYNPDNDLLTSFTISDQINIIPNQEIFKREDNLPPLNINIIKIDGRKALTTAYEFSKKEYPTDPASRAIMILQHGPEWNITFVTMTFAALNIKINAETGKVFSHNISTFTDMQMKEK